MLGLRTASYCTENEGTPTGAVAQAQVVGKFDPVYYNEVNPITGQQTMVNLRGGGCGPHYF